jgi:hypothetical protein
VFDLRGSLSASCLRLSLLIFKINVQLHVFEPAPVLLVPCMLVHWSALEHQALVLLTEAEELAQRDASSRNSEVRDHMHGEGCSQVAMGYVTQAQTWQLTTGGSTGCTPSDEKST